MIRNNAGREYYLRLREQYKPERIALAIVAESPPASGRYFYNDKGEPGEPLFAALMQHIGLDNPPKTKPDGLRRFQEKGWILVDATYEPVNELSNAQRNEIIERDYEDLRRDLESLGRPPLLLVKANVCRLLGPKLMRDGCDILNRDRVVYFPSTGQQRAFHQQFGDILK